MNKELTRRDLLMDVGSRFVLAQTALLIPSLKFYPETSANKLIHPESPRKAPEFQFNLGTVPELQSEEAARKRMRNRLVNPSFEDQEEAIVDDVPKIKPVGWKPWDEKNSIYQVNPKTGLSSVASVVYIFEKDRRKYFDSGGWLYERKINVSANQDYTFGFWSMVSDRRISPRLNMPMYDAKGNEITGGWAEFHLDDPHEWQRLYLLTIGPNSLNQWPKGVNSIGIILSTTPGSAIKVGFTGKASFDRVFFGN